MLAILPMFALMFLMPIWLPIEMIRYLITDPAMFFEIVKALSLSMVEWVNELPNGIAEIARTIMELISTII